jgi:peptidoglycan glycosyltransferase
MSVNRSISRLTNVFLALFMLLSVGVVYWQVFQSKTLATSKYNPSLCDVGNQPVRGSIYDRNGLLLAYSQQDNKAPCNYRRYYCFPSLSPIIGYYSYIYGETGLEEAYDDILTGRQASGQDAINNFWDQTLHRAVNGSDIYLTIDARVQNMIDKQYDITYDEPGGVLGEPIFSVPKGRVGAPPDEPIPPLCQQKNGTLMQQLYNQPSENAAHNHGGSIIVTDPHTGEILGMLSRPYFNANEIGDYHPCRLYTNDQTNADLPACPGAKANPPAAPAGTATPTPTLTSTIGAEYFKQLTSDRHLPLLVRPTSLYIPGSTFKTLTLSAGLDSGKIQLTNPTFGGSNCLAADSTARRYIVNGQVLQDIDLPTYGTPPSCPIDVEHGYIYSDNIIFARLGVQYVGLTTWLNYFQRFGMIDSNAQNKQPFPFDFPVKASRVDFKGARDQANEYAQDAFGQGTLQVSPLEMSFITSTVANNGVGFLPHLLLKVVPHGVDPNSVAAVSPVPYSGNGVTNGQIISAQAAAGVRQSMRGVVQIGSAGLTADTRSNMGGKTGTAQLGNADPHSWFIALAPDGPGQTPKYTVVVMKENGDEGLFQAPVADCIFLKLLGNLPNIHAGSFYPAYTCAS